MATKLEKLFIGEVSGVDDPANEIPGWMITKASGSKGLPLGPEQPWVVGEAEARVREATGASDGPNPAYAGCFLWHDPDVAKDRNDDGVPDSFGDYKFLVVDVVKEKLAVMPAALRAVGDRLPDAAIPTADKEALTKSLEQYAAAAQPNSDAEDAQSIVGKIKGLLLGKEHDVTKDELDAALDAREDALVEKLAEKLAKSVEAPEAAAPAAGDGAASEAAASAEVPGAEGAAPEAAATEPETGTEPEALTAEGVAKGIEEAVQPVLEILDKTLDRIARVEERLSVRKSLDGQESAEDGAEGSEAKEPTIGDALTSLAKDARGGTYRSVSG